MEKKFRTVMILLLTAVFISGSIPVFAQSQSVDAAEFAGGVQNVTGQTENTAETGGMAHPPLQKAEKQAASQRRLRSLTQREQIPDLKTKQALKRMMERLIAHPGK